MQNYLRTLFLGILFSSVITVTGCQNTVEGFGKDMQHNGSQIQKSVQNNN